MSIIDPDMNIYHSVYFEIMTRSAMDIVEKFCKSNFIDNVQDFNNTVSQMSFLKKEMFEKMTLETDHVILNKLRSMRMEHDALKG